MSLGLATAGMAVEKFVKDRRRHKGDRRSYRQRPEFPLRDSDGNLVLEDRRRVPDRRTASIEVDWIDEDLDL